MKTVLITGGAGFIGSHLVDSLLKKGNYKITCVDNFDAFYSAAVKRKNISGCLSNRLFNLIENDICNDELYEKLSVEKFDTIVHLAAKAGVRPSILDPESYERVNIQGTLKLLEFAKNKNIKQFVFGSSSSVYGINPHFPWSESDIVLNPISPYAATKVACELMGHTYSHLYNIRFIALRFFTVFGPRQRPDLAIHKFFKNILENQSIPFFGDGSTSRDYTYVADIVKGIEAAMEYDQTNYEVINLGNNRSITLSELLTEIEKTAGKKAVLNRQPPQAGDVPHTFANIEKAKLLLDYNPSTNMETGLKNFREWYVENKLADK